MLRCTIAVVACLFAVTAEARPRHSQLETRSCVLDNSGRQTCQGGVNRISRPNTADANGNQVIGRRPPGCPRKFCGCEASLYLFGKIRPELNLAANWIRKFPRTSPAPRMAAARPGHVFVLLSHVGGNEWLVRDGNSGGGKTRIHVRSIAGYVVVNPHGSLALR